ncbi:5-hydroxytryptamine receptor 3A-like [Argopecten irradians]|uniref:5-hydroxytryptamine receptor 3A-like n=1 Tax=Argopecten irradians TaxID=31199 RepID=UPI0037181461
MLLGKGHKMVLTLFTILIAMSPDVSFTTAASHSQVKDLYHSLIANYTSNIRPVLDQSKPVDVTVEIMLHSIKLFDEVSGELSMAGIFTFTWTDELLQWNPMSANDIASMTFTTSQVWVPQVFLTNSVNEARIYKTSDNNEVVYNPNGHALLRAFKIFDVVCQAGILHYPNDIHTCGIDVAPITRVDNINVTSINGLVMKIFNHNLIWNVESTGLSHDTSGIHSKVTFYITLSRRPSFIFLTLILPIIALNYMNILVFLIPAESGEKISYAITVLLTFAVYLSVYSDKIPPLSLPIAVFSASMLIKLCTSCLMALCCIVISKINFYNEDHKVPLSLQRLTACFLRDRKVRCVTNLPPKDQSVDLVTEDSEHKTGSLMIDGNLKMQVNWKEVSNSMDKFCLVFFAVVSTVETVVSLSLIMFRQ